MPAQSSVAPATFSFQSHTVRVIADGEHPLFVAKDVAQALGYKNTNEAINTFCKGVAKRYPLQTGGGTQEVRVIEEPDVYRLIFGSKLESAQKFQDWVFEEVLPQIRKTGAYQAPQTPVPQAVRLHHPHTSPDVPIRTTAHKGATWYRLGDVGWQLGVDAYLLARHIPKGESALLKVRDKRYGWQRCWWASARGVDAVLQACAHKPEATRVRDYLQLPTALPTPQPSLTGLPDGRYLLVVEGGLPHLRDIRDKAVVDNRFVWTLRRNFKTLSDQMRLLTGEAGECILDLQLQDLQEVQA